VEILERRASVAGEERGPTEEHRSEDLVTCAHFTERAARHIEEWQRPRRAAAACHDECLQHLKMSEPDRLPTSFLHEPEHRVPVTTGELVERLVVDNCDRAETVTSRVGE